MSMTVTTEMLRVCRLAMYQLRQDVGVPSTVSEAGSDTSTEWAKCKEYYEIAYNEVLQAHNWTWKRTTAPTTVDTWPNDAKNALVYCLARELAVPIGGRTEDMKNCHQLYQQKLTTARLTDLTGELASNTDAVLAQLVANFKADDPGLVNAFTVYTARKTAVMTQCENAAKKDFEVSALADVSLVAANCLAVARLAPACGLDANVVQAQMAMYEKLLAEYKQRKLATDVDTESSTIFTACLGEVKQTLGWATGDTVDDLMKAAAKCLCYARNGARYGYDANFVNLKEQEYASKIQQWRKVKLDASRTTDAVLDQLVGLFKGDDTSLANAWSAYETRKATVLAQCTSAVQEAFEVSGALTGVPAMAANCLAVAKLAPAFGLDSSVSATQMQMYDRMLAEHKQQKLADDADNTTSAIYTECLAEVKATLGITAGTVDALVAAAAKCLCYVRNGVKSGYETGFVQIKEQEYASKIQQWRKIQLDAAIRDNTDPLFAELIGSFKADDAGLANAFEVYQNRIDAVKSDCEREVRQHFDDWASDTNSVAVDADAETVSFNSATVSGEVLTLTYASEKYWRPAYDALVRSRMAAAMGFDAGVVQAYVQEYNLKLLRGIKEALDRKIAASGFADAVLAQLVANFKADDVSVVPNFAALTNRVSLVKAESAKEVKRVLGITALDDLAQAAADCLSVSNLCAAFGIDANFANLKKQEYAALIQQWRKVQLDAALSANSDPVLTQLLANFKAEDGGLTNAFAVYTQRSGNVKALAENEINREQEWRTPFDWDAEGATQHVAYAAWVALCVSKLALPCGMDVNAAGLLEKKYVSELQAAKVTDLEAAKAAITDDDTKQVLSLVLANFSAEDSRLPRSLGAVTGRIAANKARARVEIMEAHNWSFARDEYLTGGCSGAATPEEAYRWSTPVPPKCARVLACRGMDGRQVEWKLDGKTLLAMEPISTITYLRDIEDVAKWPAALRSAYIALLAADVATMVTGSAGEAQRLWQIYEKRLADVKLTDAKASGVRREQRGGNYYVERMLGGGRPARGAVDDVLRRG